MRLLIVALCFVVVNGCSTVGATVEKYNHIHVGMSKDEAIKIAGTPITTTNNGDGELLFYKEFETREDKVFSRRTPYFIKIKDGKVSAYGRGGNEEPFMK